MGCCTADQCKNGCFSDTLRPAVRSTSLANLSPGGSCGGQTPMWTCEMAPTFWGCCNENPCTNNSTCPPGKLEPAFWDRPDQYYYFHDLNVALSSSVPDPTTSSTVGSTPSSSPSTTSPPTATPSSSGASGAVIGGAAGGLLVLLLIIAIVVFLLCRRQRNKKKNTETEGAKMSVIPKAELASPTTSIGLSRKSPYNQASRTCY